MRRYWIPIAPYAQLLENPVRKVRFLGEDLVLYRDRLGKLGLIGDRCLHRQVDMQYGIPDECGLRCPYHGWLYDANGNCVERPLEAHPTRPIAQKLKNYPVQELGGLIFAYMGPAPVPALPRWDLYVWPNAIRQIAVNTLNCNWLQCQENTGDPTHSVWAHGQFFKYQLERSGELDRISDPKHTVHGRVNMGVGLKDLYVNETELGYQKGLVFSKELGAAKDDVSLSPSVIFPFCTRTGREGSPRSEYQLRIPIDDTHTYHICYQVYAAPPEVEASPQNIIPWYEPPTVDDKGRPMLDYVLAQDAVMWEAQGPITDRTLELLGRTDKVLVFLRRQLEEQISRVEAGLVPMNVFGESPDMIPTAPRERDVPDVVDVTSLYRSLYHKGFGSDDVDRYGPALEMIKDLHRRIEEYGLARATAAANRG